MSFFKTLLSLNIEDNDDIDDNAPHYSNVITSVSTSSPEICIAFQSCASGRVSSVESRLL